MTEQQNDTDVNEAGNKCVDMLESTGTAIDVAQFAASRANEIKTMMHALEGPRKGKRIFQRLPRHMRRRAMSHNVKRLPRSMRRQGEKEMKQSKPTQKRGADTENEDGEPSKKRSRRHRRRPKNLRSEFNRRQRKYIWLETHLWHAKRFKMEDRWGHRIPLHSNEKGVRAAYRSVSKYCLMQDISYYGVLELMGSQDDILIILNEITNKETGINIYDERYLNGSHYGRSMLYKKDRYPFGAIAPIDFMWNAIPGKPTTPSDVPTRQLWLWLHPACYDEAFEEIQGLCAKDGINGITVNDLRPDLVRFHFEGPLSHSILIDTLKVADVKTSKPVGECLWWETAFMDPDNLTAFQEQSILWEGMSSVQTATVCDSNSMMGLTVTDPRHLLPRKRSQAVIATTTARESKTTSLKPSATSCWSAIWDKNVRKQVKESQLSQHTINQMRSKQLVPGTPLNLGRQESRIPVMILQNPGCQTPSTGLHSKPNFGILGYGAGWDVILPSGWGMEFWVAFYYRGARVGGRCEASSSYLQQGIPEFPLDFPDTQSGKLYTENLRTDLVTNYMKKPPAKRLNYSKIGTENPFLHPWQQLASCWIRNEKDDNVIDKMQVDLTEHISSEESNDVYVLRNTQYLNHLQSQCVGKMFKKPKNFIVPKEIHPIKTVPENTELDMETMVTDMETNAPSLFIGEALSVLKTSLVFVRMRMVNRGAPSIFAMICLPTKEDLKTLEKNPSSPGPIEPNHEGLPIPRVGKKHGKKKIKLDDKNHHSKLDKEVIKQLHSDPTVQVTSTANIDCCTRTVIGYVTNGAHAFSVGAGCSVGLCSFLGLSKLLQQKVPERNAVVLIRDNSSVQYRYAYVSVPSITF